MGGLRPAVVEHRMGLARPANCEPRRTRVERDRCSSHSHCVAGVIVWTLALWPGETRASTRPVLSSHATACSLGYAGERPTSHRLFLGSRSARPMRESQERRFQGWARLLIARSRSRLAVKAAFSFDPIVCIESAKHVMPEFGELRVVLWGVGLCPAFAGARTACCAPSRSCHVLVSEPAAVVRRAGIGEEVHPHRGDMRLAGLSSLCERVDPAL